MQAEALPFLQLMKKAISFFLVEHEQGDIFGFLLAWCCYAPPFIIAIQTAVLMTLLLQSRTTVSGRSGKPSRAIKLASMLLLGQLLNEALNLVLKNIIKQERPESRFRIRIKLLLQLTLLYLCTYVDNHGFKDYGMPSSHSQFMAFLAVSFPFLASAVVSATDLPCKF